MSHKGARTEPVARPPHVLVVASDAEEELRTRELLEEALGADVRIRWTSTPEEAVEAMADSDLDVALVELRPGDGAALEVLLEARRPALPLPVIVLAREEDRAADLRLGEAGAADFLVLSRIRPGDLDRSIRYAIAHGRTLRRLRRSEERFRALAENMTETLVLTSPDGELLYASPSFGSLAGVESPSFVGRNVFDLIVPEDRGTATDSLRMVIEGTHPPGPLQFRIRRPDGGVRILEASGENLLDNPAVEGLLISLRDVSGRVALEERLREAQRLEAVGQLAGGVAHDFNNILTALAGHTELLLEDLAPEDPVRMDLEEIRKGIQRATGLTSRLLAFSRRQILMVRVLDLGDVLRGVEDLLRRVLRSNIDLVLEARDPGLVRADPNQLEQVILNLAINARDAMPAGGTLHMVVESAVITPEAARSHPYAVVPGDYLRLTVSDTGEGMDEATLARIFEPFFTTKPVGVGTGLGLAMVYGVVKQSQGYVWAESRPGEGARFRIYLPRVPAESGRTHAPEAGIGA